MLAVGGLAWRQLPPPSPNTHPLFHPLSLIKEAMTASQGNVLSFLFKTVQLLPCREKIDIRARATWIWNENCSLQNSLLVDHFSEFQSRKPLFYVHFDLLKEEWFDGLIICLSSTVADCQGSSTWNAKFSSQKNKLNIPKENLQGLFTLPNCALMLELYYQCQTNL